MYTVGYAVSFSSLLVAIFIIGYFRYHSPEWPRCCFSSTRSLSCNRSPKSNHTASISAGVCYAVSCTSHGMPTVQTCQLFFCSFVSGLIEKRASTRDCISHKCTSRGTCFSDGTETEVLSVAIRFIHYWERFHSWGSFEIRYGIVSVSKQICTLDIKVLI